MAKNNRTLTLSEEEFSFYQTKLLKPRYQGAFRYNEFSQDNLKNKTVLADITKDVRYLASFFVDLLIIDPPYNLSKQYGDNEFRAMSNLDYQKWFEAWFNPLLTILNPTASVYVCSDWKTSALIYPILEEYLHVRNRITWERDKGRGAKTNWKNNSEDIWFCTASDLYTFNVDAVKLKRKVLAPYKDTEGNAKDWNTDDGSRLTYPSNLWTDITVPFWSMPENTEHPTQKPEKLIAKLILASSNEGDWVFDPFLGSGTTSVVAKKLNRIYTGVELNERYACIAEKRLTLAENNKTIQGYTNNVFLDRNFKE